MAGYRAVRRILHNGIGAYNPGDPVDARAVEPDGWVSRDDVEPAGTAADLVEQFDDPALTGTEKGPAKRTGSK